jgi:preprotein translocase subunit YajC
LVEQVFAMATNGGGQQGGGGFAMLLPFLLIFAILYFLMIRPQIKRQKQMQKMLDALQKGDRVVTSGGIYAVISGIKEKEGTLILKIDNDVKIEVQRTAVARVLGEKG